MSQWIVAPRTGAGSYMELYQLIGWLYANPLLYTEAVTVQMQNASGQLTAGEQVMARLIASGLSVTPPMIVPVQDRTLIYDYTRGQAPETARVMRAAARAFYAP